MMVLHRTTGMLEHKRMADIADYLTPDDLLVVNDTKVFPARLVGVWADSPGHVEMLLVSPAAGGLESESALSKSTVQWHVMVGSGRPARHGQQAIFGPERELSATLTENLGGGLWKADFAGTAPLGELLDKFGRTPVPPYVHREGTYEEEVQDRLRYQTIYAKHVGSVAAPTAGLHFTQEIFATLDAKGVKRTSVTLHVGPGTFRPVKAENIEDHHMDFEAFTVPPEAADAINATKAAGGRVVCVGSTSVRTLESVAAREHDEDEPLIVPGSGASDIFIYPPYRFKVADAMLTNFHLPQSTLLMMTSAFAGRERMLASYALAVRNGYRFFSYGDAMLII